MSDKKNTETKKKSFSKAQLLKSKQYSGIEKNILDVVMDDKESMTHEKARKAIDDFKKRKVK